MVPVPPPRRPCASKLHLVFGHGSVPDDRMRCVGAACRGRKVDHIINQFRLVVAPTEVAVSLAIHGLKRSVAKNELIQQDCATVEINTFNKVGLTIQYLTRGPITLGHGKICNLGLHDCHRCGTGPHRSHGDRCNL